MSILGEQKRRHLYIGEAVVAVGGLTTEGLERYLQEFKDDQAKYATDKVIIPTGVEHSDQWEMMSDLTYKMLTRVARVTFHSEACTLIDTLPSFPVIASMDIFGDISVKYLFGCTEGLQNKIAQAILGSDDVSKEPKEVLDDTVMEFVNVVCGNIVAKAVQLGKKTDISPPQLLDPQALIEIQNNETGLLFPIYLAEGDKGALILIVNT
jgi:CheY-specific phosphatase CheX